MTQIERKAWWGWTIFRSRMEEIWNTYSRYGEVVLEKDLEKDDEKFKSLFKQANGNKLVFLRIIREFWENNYHFVASDFKGLLNLLNQYRENGVCDELSVLPETGSYRDGETKGCDLTFSITKELYDQVRDLTKGRDGTKVLLVNYDTKKLVEIGFSQYNSPSTYSELLVHECCTVIET